ncbi:hypothetical protein EVA_11395, partial [gut metagenome]
MRDKLGLGYLENVKINQHISKNYTLITIP